MGLSLLSHFTAILEPFTDNRYRLAEINFHFVIARYSFAQ